MLLLGEHYVILARVLSIRIELVRSHLSMKGSSAFVCLAWDSKVSAVAMDHKFLLGWVTLPVLKREGIDLSCDI